MMQGYVNNNYEATILVVVCNQSVKKSVKAIIDTGFLSLPDQIITELKLPWSYRDRGTLGDGSEVIFDIYNAQVIWDGKIKEIEINSAETEPLIGMSLIRGFRMQIDADIGGLVTIINLNEIS